MNLPSIHPLNHPSISQPSTQPFTQPSAMCSLNLPLPKPIPPAVHLSIHSSILPSIVLSTELFNQTPTQPTIHDSFKQRVLIEHQLYARPWSYNNEQTIHAPHTLGNFSLQGETDMEIKPWRMSGTEPRSVNKDICWSAELAPPGKTVLAHGSQSLRWLRICSKVLL